jgi:Stigma-specific protein, Stig1/Putative metal-binding motif
MTAWAKIERAGRFCSTVIVLACALSACAFRDSLKHCSTDQQCEPLSCYRGFCVRNVNATPKADASAMIDGSIADGAIGVRTEAGRPVPTHFDASPDTGTRDAADAGCSQDANQFCYAGPSDTATVGQCKAGVMRCDHGLFGSCIGQVLPTDELCNKLDDDCDGKIDEEIAVGSCATDNNGACTTGALMCAEGAARCVAVLSPATEICDGIDNDCDGMTDEETEVRCYPSATAGCTNSDTGWTCTGTCAVGKQVCQLGKLLECSGAIVPSAEVCTMSGAGVDENCDGRIDETCACAPVQTQACYTGTSATRNVSPCKDGTQSCVNGGFGSCQGMVAPQPEVCDQIDNDCDGKTDNVPGLGNTCTVDANAGECRLGMLACQSGSAMPACVTRMPGTVNETCNARDDDCDGKTDEDFNLSTDAANCGSCAHACGAGQACCAGTCADTTSDNAHCGSMCLACGSGRLCCAGECVDESPAHCGGCGLAHTCQAGDLCCSSRCMAQDLANCGMCGHACATGDLCCGGQCVHAQSDAANCGACGKACGAAAVACCSGQCVDLASDPMHCGSCTSSCRATVPDAGVCTCTSGSCVLSGSSVTCLSP